MGSRGHRIVSCVAACALTACPGTIDDEDAFRAERGGVSGGECPDVGELFARSCTASICHDSDEPAGDLDLLMPGFDDRVVGVQASDVVCSDRVLVDPLNVERSFMIEKLESVFPQCGDPMPLTGELPQFERDCIREWIESLVPSPGDGGANDANPDAAATDAGSADGGG